MKLFGLLNKFALNVAETEESITSLIDIDFSRLPMTLKHMGVGMLSIFVVIGVIIMIIYLLNKTMASLEEKKKAKEQENND